MAGGEWEEASFKRRVVEIQADSRWEDKVMERKQWSCSVERGS